jgi:glycosyltransferase involved in cell wall biosynthesis
VRIVHLVIGGDVAGGQLVARSLARAAREAGHEVSFLSPSAGPFTELVEGEGFGVRVVPLGGALDIGSLVRLRRALKQLDANVVHTHGHFSVNVLGRVAGRLAGARVVAHMHIENAFRAAPLGRALQVALDDATARLCSRILVVSDATRQILARQGYPRRMEVVRNGIVGERVGPLRLDGIPDGAPLVVHVGRLAPVKGQRELIEALPMLDGVHVVLVGVDLESGGDYRRELESFAASLGVADRVVFAGYRDDVPALLAGADVFTLPSRMEGLPLVVLEAMAQARPVVATAVGGTPELVEDAVTGLLVPPGDVAALASALRSLLDDPARARTLGEAGRRRFEEQFTTAAMTDPVLEVYAELARTMPA